MTTVIVFNYVYHSFLLEINKNCILLVLVYELGVGCVWEKGYGGEQGEGRGERESLYLKSLNSEF